MIKFAFGGKLGPSYGFGLSARNLELLKEGKPILVNLNEMGGLGEVLIFYGETERDMAKELRGFIGPETKITIDPRLNIDLGDQR